MQMLVSYTGFQLRALDQDLEEDLLSNRSILRPAAYRQQLADNLPLLQLAEFLKLPVLDQQFDKCKTLVNIEHVEEDPVVEGSDTDGVVIIDVCASRSR